MKNRELRRLLSPRQLEDVPPSVRIGSPYDSSDALVIEWAKKGVLHPGTNYGVVYRVAFAPNMNAGETPASEALPALPVEGMPTSLIMRFCWVIPHERFSDSGDEFMVSGQDFASGFLAGWVLLTNRGIRWHYTGDGAPSVHPGASIDLGEGIRRLGYKELKGRSAHHHVTMSVSDREADIDFFVFGVMASWAATSPSGSPVLMPQRIYAGTSSSHNIHNLRGIGRHTSLPQSRGPPG
jgi:hypothetical protein